MMFEPNLHCPAQCYADIDTMLCLNCAGDLLDDMGDALNKDSPHALTNKGEITNARALLQSPISKLHRVPFMVNVIVNRMILLDFILSSANLSVDLERSEPGIALSDTEQRNCQILIENAFWFLENLLLRTMQDRTDAPGLKLGDLSNGISSGSRPVSPSRCGDYHNVIPLIRTWYDVKRIVQEHARDKTGMKGKITKYVQYTIRCSVMFGLGDLLMN